MRILELSLQAFGPFTDVTLDLSGGAEGLHLVYGPNEAGKSSALRGLRQALFGFPTQSPDDFVHPYAKFRVGMRLRDDEGQELAFVRRKGNRQTLLAVDGSTPLPDDSVARLLGGMNEAEFGRRFAMDHDELVAGGKSILDGAGELGQLLFQSGGGLRDLLDVRRGLDRDLDALFKPSGSKPKINAGLAQLKEARAAVRSDSLPSSEWVENDAAHRRAVEQLDAVEGRLDAARAERRRLERIADALPVLARLRQCRQEQDALGPLVLLPDDFSKQRHDAVIQLESARATESAATRAIAEVEAQLEALVVPDDLLDQADAIERLRDALAGYRKGQDTLPVERSHLDHIEKEIARDRDELAGIAGSSASATSSSRKLILRRSNELPKLDTEREHAAARVAELSARLESDQAERAALGDPDDAGPLAVALRQARDLGDIDDRIATAEARVEQADADANRALARLPLWSGSLGAIAERPAPTVETVDRFETEFAAIDAERARLRSRRETATAESDAASARLDALRAASGVLPTEDDLDRARAVRDRLWRLLRRTVESPDSPPTVEDIQAALAEDSSDPDPDPKLAPAFERAMERADRHADRLRREADRVAEQAAARAERERADRRLHAIDESARQVEIRAVEVLSRWRALWEPLGIDPASPREMRAWLQSRLAVLQKADEARALRMEFNEIRARSATHRDAILRALAAFEDLSDLPRSDGLGPPRDRAEAVAQRLDRAASRREELDHSIVQTRRQLEAAGAQLEAVEERLKAWRTSWASAVEPLGLPADATPEQAEAVLELAAALAARVKEARDVRERIEASRRDGERFAAEVADVGRETGGIDGDLSDPSVVIAAAQDLIRRLADARKAGDAREALLRRRDREHNDAESARRDRETAAARLEALCREARCDTPDDLPAAERASADARRLRDRVQELEQQLDQLRGHEPMDAFQADALAVDVDRLPDQIAALAVEIERLDAERKDLIDTRATLRGKLAQMAGDGRAAEANERVEQLKSRLTEDVEEYARLRLAALVLREAIERHRQKTQGPVLDRAGALFAALTLGSFAGLRVEYDDRDQAVLHAVRPGGSDTVEIQGLSLGTADQLYLALRLAGLEAALDVRGPVPLIADDILIQFDDDRTSATLGLLAGLSDRTQVVLFTHHAHVLELARSVVSAERLFVHRLPGRPGLDVQAQG